MGGISLRRPLLGVAAGTLSVAAVAAAIGLFDDWVPVLSLGALFVLAVLPIAVYWGTWHAVAVAIASMLTFNFFFLPPIHTLTLSDSRNWFALAVYSATAIVVGALASRARRGTVEAMQRENESTLLADVASELLRGASLEAELEQIGERAARVLGVTRAQIELGGTEPAGRSPHPLPVGEAQIGTLYTPDGEEPALSVQRRVLPALASLLAVAAERDRLAGAAVEAEALRLSDTAKTAVIRAVSHDLRTPLATIETALDGLESDVLALTEADRAELLQTIRAEHRRLKRFVENLLDLSRIQAAAAPPSAELWTADELISRALDGLPGAARVTVRAPADLPAVSVDADQVQRALANVVDNALRFSPVDQPVRITVNATRKELLFRVTDHGPGIPEDERERIFEPFHHVPGDRDTSGAGLGLAIARGFAAANGGRLWVEPREAPGTTFVLALNAEPVPVGLSR